MNKKSLLILILTLSIFAIFASTVSAQQGGMIEQLLKPFGNIEEAYDKYSALIDMVIYLIIFIGLARWTLSKGLGGLESGKGKNALITGIGIIFAVSLALWERQAGFNIKAFGPVAMVILVALMCFALYTGLRSIKGDGDEPLVGHLSAAFASFSIFYLVVMSFGVGAWIGEKVPLLAAILGLIFLASIIYLFYIVGKWVWSKVPSFGGGGGKTASEDILRIPPSGKRPSLAPPLGRKEAAPKAPKEEKKLKKEEKKLFKAINREEKQAMVEEKEFREVFDDTKNAFKKFEEMETPKNQKAKKKLVKDADKALEKVGKDLKKALRKEKREVRFAVRAKNLADVLKKDLDRIGTINEKKRAELIDEETKKALGLAIKAEQDVNSTIKSVDAIENQVSGLKEENPERGMTHANLLKSLQAIARKVKKMDSYLKAILVLDEKIKSLVLEEEAQTK